jgi:hypothetical protein
MEHGGRLSLKDITSGIGRLIIPRLELNSTQVSTFIFSSLIVWHPDSVLHQSSEVLGKSEESRYETARLQILGYQAPLF